jgi:hypothetical protein
MGVEVPDSPGVSSSRTECWARLAFKRTDCEATASVSVTLPELRFMNGGRGIESSEGFLLTGGVGRLPCNGTGRAGPSVAEVIISIDCIGSSGTGELGAEYRLFILILVGIAPDVSFLERRKAGVDIRILAGNTGGLIGLGESVNLIFLTEDLDGGSSFFLVELSVLLPEDLLIGFLDLLILPSLPLSSCPITAPNPSPCASICFCFRLLNFILFIPLCVNVHQGGSSSDPSPSSSVSSHEDSEVEYRNLGRLRRSLFLSSGCNGSTSVESLDARAGDGGVVGSNAADAIYVSTSRET